MIAPPPLVSGVGTEVEAGAETCSGYLSPSVAEPEVGLCLAFGVIMIFPLC